MRGWQTAWHDMAARARVSMRLPCEMRMRDGNKISRLMTESLKYPKYLKSSLFKQVTIE